MTYEDVRERAEELRMEAALGELGVLGPSPGLVHAILSEARDERAPAAALATGWRARWLMAAALLAGVGIVATVAWMRARGPEQGAVAPVQEPEERQEPTPQEPVPQEKKEGKQQPKPMAPFVATLMADYSDNVITGLDTDGKELLRIDQVFGAWDCEKLANGNLLVTEFSVSRVREITTEGETVWKFHDLKNPYCATRLKNGNTLIADTFASRILEVKPDGSVFWEYGRGEGEEIRPFDVEQTDKGTFLISDVLKDRVFEIDYHGNVIWECRDLPNVHDADRLANGNTLVTLRNKGEVREIGKNGEVVWQLKKLLSPSDADRLPNGNTLVAENTRVREFDKDGLEVARIDATWCVEVNRYTK